MTNVLPTRISDFLDGIGVNVDDVGPQLGEGWQHKVHRFKEKGKEMVLKYPHIGRDWVRSRIFSLITPKPDEAKRDIDLANEYFGEFTLPTEVRTGSDPDLYCMIQEPVTFTTISLEDADEAAIAAQIEQICECNRALIADEQLWCDLAGVDLFNIARGRPYLNNVIQIETDSTTDSKPEKLLRLPDVSLYQSADYDAGDKASRLQKLKHWWHQRLLAFQEKNMRGFGFDFA